MAEINFFGIGPPDVGELDGVVGVGHARCKATSVKPNNFVRRKHLLTFRLVASKIHISKEDIWHSKLHWLPILSKIPLKRYKQCVPIGWSDEVAPGWKAEVLDKDHRTNLKWINDDPHDSEL